MTMSSRLFLFCLVLLISASSFLSVHADSPKVTPVDVDDDAPRTVLHYYDKHGKELKEPVMFLATLDTIARPRSKPPYPVYNGYSVGINFGDVLMWAALGRKYGGIDLHADVSIHNWFFPTLELGLGMADSTPRHHNFTYRTPVYPYFRIGADYNFVYKSNPDYRFFLGLRGGFSAFRYSIDNITIDSPYWGETDKFSMTGLKSYALWGEVLAGLKVKIVGCFSLGWSVRYKIPFHIKKTRAGDPWYIPGLGATDSPVGVSLSAIFTFGGKPPRKETDLIPQEIEQVLPDEDNQRATLPERRPLSKSQLDNRNNKSEKPEEIIDPENSRNDENPGDTLIP